MTTEPFLFQFLTFVQRLLVEFQSNEEAPILSDLYSHTPGDQVLPQHRDSIRIDGARPDPNERSLDPPSNDTLTYWLKLCDWYTDLMPHVILYDSVRELVNMLNSTMTEEKLTEVSLRMADANRLMGSRLKDQWIGILNKIAAVRLSTTALTTKTTTKTTTTRITKTTTKAPTTKQLKAAVPAINDTSTLKSTTKVTAPPNRAVAAPTSTSAAAPSATKQIATTSKPDGKNGTTTRKAG
jgi:hypothetical protein